MSFQRQNRVQTLDAMRGVAVLAVFAYHLTTNEALARFFSPEIRSLLVLGGLGVELFYVLSGYFITKAILSPSQFDPTQFLKARVTRIYPAYLVCLAVTACVAADIRGANFETLVLCLLLHLGMLHYLFPGVASLFNGVFWTLGVEFPYYLLMLALGGIIRSSRGFWAATAGMLACAWLMRASVFFFIPIDLYGGMGRFFFSMQMPGVLDLFALGGCAAWVTRRWPVVPGWVRHTVLWGGLALTILFLRQAMNGHGGFWGDRYLVTYWRTALALALAMLVCAGVWTRPGAWLRATGLAAVGKISFSVYLWHYPIICLIGTGRADWPAALQVPLVVGLTLGVSWMSWRFVEKPFHPGPADVAPDRPHAVQGGAAGLRAGVLAAH